MARSERGRNEMEGVRGRLTAGDHQGTVDFSQSTSTRLPMGEGR
ncbi:hypothetical protein X947_5302 [Burkholderia pseudomallei MSHR7334]|nr:hypothetical protein X947_5302 [Burkholderia pseudomallei MSHR7334]